MCTFSRRNDKIILEISFKYDRWFIFEKEKILTTDMKTMHKDPYDFLQLSNKVYFNSMYK